MTTQIREDAGSRAQLVSLPAVPTAVVFIDILSAVTTCRRLHSSVAERQQQERGQFIAPAVVAFAELIGYLHRRDGPDRTVVVDVSGCTPQESGPVLSALYYELHSRGVRTLNPPLDDRSGGTVQVGLPPFCVPWNYGTVEGWFSAYGVSPSRTRWVCICIQTPTDGYMHPHTVYVNNYDGLTLHAVQNAKDILCRKVASQPPGNSKSPNSQLSTGSTPDLTHSESVPDDVSYGTQLLCAPNDTDDAVSKTTATSRGSRRKKKKKSLPLDTVLQGVVKRYNPSRGYGFITCDGIDLFVHQADIVLDGFRALNVGASVDFKVDPRSVDTSSITSSDLTDDVGERRRLQAIEVVQRVPYRPTFGEQQGLGMNGEPTDVPPPPPPPPPPPSHRPVTPAPATRAPFQVHNHREQQTSNGPRASGRHRRRGRGAANCGSRPEWSSSYDYPCSSESGWRMPDGTVVYPHTESSALAPHPEEREGTSNEYPVERHTEGQGTVGGGGGGSCSEEHGWNGNAGYNGGQKEHYDYGYPPQQYHCHQPYPHADYSDDHHRNYQYSH